MPSPPIINNKDLQSQRFDKSEAENINLISEFVDVLKLVAEDLKKYRSTDINVQLDSFFYYLKGFKGNLDEVRRLKTELTSLKENIETKVSYIDNKSNLANDAIKKANDLIVKISDKTLFQIEDTKDLMVNDNSLKKGTLIRVEKAFKDSSGTWINDSWALYYASNDNASKNISNFKEIISYNVYASMQIADKDEINAGTNNTKAITPLGLAQSKYNLKYVPQLLFPFKNQSLKDSTDTYEFSVEGTKLFDGDYLKVKEYSIYKSEYHLKTQGLTSALDLKNGFIFSFNLKDLKWGGTNSKLALYFGIYNVPSNKDWYMEFQEGSWERFIFNYNPSSGSNKYIVTPNQRASSDAKYHTIEKATDGKDVLVSYVFHNTTGTTYETKLFLNGVENTDYSKTLDFGEKIDFNSILTNTNCYISIGNNKRDSNSPVTYKIKNLIIGDSLDYATKINKIKNGHF